MPPYKPIRYVLASWMIIKELADLLSQERGQKVSLPEASVEAAKRMLEERKAQNAEARK